MGISHRRSISICRVKRRKGDNAPTHSCITTGVSYRKLDLPGVERGRLTGARVYYGASYGRSDII